MLSNSEASIIKENGNQALGAERRQILRCRSPKESYGQDDKKGDAQLFVMLSNSEASIIKENGNQALVQNAGGSFAVALRRSPMDRMTKRVTPDYFSAGFFFQPISFSTILTNRSVRVFSCLAERIQTTYSFLLE